MSVSMLAVLGLAITGALLLAAFGGYEIFSLRGARVLRRRGPRRPLGVAPRWDVVGRR